MNLLPLVWEKNNGDMDPELMTMALFALCHLQRLVTAGLLRCRGANTKYGGGAPGPGPCMVWRGARARAAKLYRWGHQVWNRAGPSGICGHILPIVARWGQGCPLACWLCPSKSFAIFMYFFYSSLPRVLLHSSVCFKVLQTTPTSLPTLVWLQIPALASLLSLVAAWPTPETGIGDCNFPARSCLKHQEAGVGSGVEWSLSHPIRFSAFPSWVVGQVRK